MNPARVELIIGNLVGLPVTVTEDVAPYTFEVEIATGERVVDLLRAYERLLEIKPSHQAVQLTTRHQTMTAEVYAGAGMALFSTTLLSELAEVHDFGDQVHPGGSAQIFSGTALPELTETQTLKAEARAAGAAHVFTTTTLREYKGPAIPLVGSAGYAGATGAITGTPLPEY